MNNTGYALVPACDVSVGDNVCERDGYMFTVIASEFAGGKYTFTLKPFFATPGTSSAPRTCTVNRSASVRVAVAA